MTAVTETYLETLLFCYEEEIEGEAYFSALSGRFAHPDHKAKLAFLARDEAHAAKGVAPLIAKYRLKSRSTVQLVESGAADANATQADWDGPLTEITKTYPHYGDAFERLDAMGSPEDRPTLSFLTEHEVTAMAFLALEAFLPADSTKPLHTFLALSSQTSHRPGAAA